MGMTSILEAATLASSTGVAIAGVVPVPIMLPVVRFACLHVHFLTQDRYSQTISNSSTEQCKPIQFKQWVRATMPAKTHGTNPCNKHVVQSPLFDSFFLHNNVKLLQHETHMLEVRQQRDHPFPCQQTDKHRATHSCLLHKWRHTANSGGLNANTSCICPVCC
jgi:hypothetical protein